MFPVTHSVLSQRALAADVVPSYVSAPAECRLLVKGMNDTYLVLAERKRFILRVYRHGHRTLADIRHEIDLLQHVYEGGGKVAVPIVRRDGDYLTELSAPEGTRYAAMFTYAPGASRPLTQEMAALYGKAAAELHRAMEMFRSEHERYRIDTRYLLDDGTPSIIPLLTHRDEDRAFVQRLWRFLRERLDTMSPSLKQGLCHGDLNGGNCHIDDEGQVTFFDFDCEGLGWQAYDLAVFNWSVRDRPDRELALKLWQTYLDAYGREMHIGEADYAAIPYFVAARQLWLVGLHCRHADEWTYGYLTDAYFDRRLKLLRDLVREQGWPV
ncbi:phosphotransferase enzyme family protein [Paenibacillus ginsengarvi]|uniref:Aminoglycoside phosphotransferase domain-containing protein n=1 Tax=Paenibacillus ginsengarvi TaxID=400777 RepID=A0A3B0AVC7_9BACL|nr:phosphotransferase [Paenibacillus ginsengarvi]RKN64895.1 hypothetical protein D7M11_33435 [Paenibacillus ginsengarvi]